METKIEPKLLKGFRDFSPQQMLKRNYVIQKVRDVMESYGFDPLEVPTLEYQQILTGNIGADEKLIFHFVDDGGREVAMRYDQTVGACRYIAMNYHNLAMPFKRYQVQNVFRAENTQKGRYREFLQMDADIFGVDEVGADCEMILLTGDIYKHLGFTDFIIYVSDRALLKDISYEVLVTIDKLDKIGKEGVISEIKEKGYQDAANIVERVLSLEPNERIQAILDRANDAGFGEHVVFDPSIMRSFSYSTGTIWEVKVDGYGSSLLGGERFDSLVSRFSNLQVPGVGFGLGFDRTIEAMEVKGLLQTPQTNSQAMITLFNNGYMKTYLDYATRLRNAGVHTEIYPVEEKLGKQFKYADRKGIRFVLTIGDEEMEKEVVKLKNMQTTKEQVIPFEVAVDVIKQVYE